MSKCQVGYRHAKIKVTNQSVHGTVQFDLFDVFAQGFAFFAADLVGVFDDLLKSAVLVDPFGRESVADSGNAGDVVSGFSAQGGQIRVLRGRDMIFLLHGIRGHMFEVFEMVAGIQHGDVVVDQLESITVAGQHQCAVACLVAHAGERAYHIVTFVTGFFDVCDAQGRQHLLD